MDNVPRETCLQGPFAPGPAWYFGRILSRAEVERLYEAGLRSKSEVKRIATMMGGSPVNLGLVALGPAPAGDGPAAGEGEGR